MAHLRPSFRPLFAIAFAALGLASCHEGAPSRGSGKAYPREQTLYVGGRQWGEPSSFNPLAGNPDWPVISGVKLLYETLFLYDSLSGKLAPLLAESYARRDGAIEVVLHEKARWNDGRPVTAWDVKYSFELGKRYKDTPVAQVWPYLKEIQLPEVSPGTAEGEGHPRKLLFILNPERENPLVLLDGFQEFRIVPRHVIQPLLASVNDDMSRFLKIKFHDAAQAVCSGPYKIDSIQSEKIGVVRNDDYWGNEVLYGGKKPAPKYIVHPIYKSNDHFSVALQQGKLDVSSTYIPRIWLKQRKGVHTWFSKEPFYLPQAIPSLFINHGHKPLGDVHLRRAMGFAINYKDVRELAVSGYSPPLKPGLILPFGVESKYYSEEDAKKYGTSYDPERAKAELREGGYTAVWGAKGELVETRDARGNKVPTLYVKSPTGWTDWESIVSIVVQSMRAVGIDVRERFVDASLFWQSLYVGNFDLIMWTPYAQPTPSKPWSRLDYVMTSADFAPEGQKMFKNMGRFNDPKSPAYVPRVDELLRRIPNLTDERELTEAYRELNALFMQLQPSLPLVYRADQQYQFSTRVWENWATAENPYAPPQVPGDRMGTPILWHLRPKAAN
ncbi:MAG TPA: ABC transporter substrate-binding protein [Polyangiaceae bacterium]|nr:ABC transporter substrate-binding protein [Polyangiaceae bacterium]